ncbi:MAG: hypothetical protein ABSF17_02980 [Terracidiphilus sp.]|jgi:mannose-6-phosphate isomerase-like protein (cupin superfamily)
MKLIWIAIIASVATGAFAQSQPRAEVFPSAQIHDQLEGLVKQAESSGSSGATLGEYGTHAVKISERAASGGAEMHAHFVDIFYVTAGKATLITGGQIVAPRKGDDGETTGTGILDGKAHPIGVGDVVHIPAGVPHQLLVAPGSHYSAVVIKVKE